MSRGSATADPIQAGKHKPRLAIASIALLLIGLTFLALWLRQRARVFELKEHGAHFQTDSFFTPDWLASPEGIVALELANRRVDADLVHLLAPLQGLRSVNLKGSTGVDALMPGFANATKLRRLTLARTDVSDEGFAYVAGMLALEELYLDQTALTNVAFQHLQGLTNLKRITSPWALSDEGMRYLEGLKQLRFLSLTDTSASDEGMYHLQALIELEMLYLERTQLSDDGLRYLTGLTQLRTLRLDGTQVSDAGLQHIAHLPELERLTLCDTNVTAQGLEQLSSVPRLQILVLDGTQVTDEAIEHLAAIPALTSLTIRSPAVSDATLQRLKETLPHGVLHLSW